MKIDNFICAGWNAVLHKVLRVHGFICKSVQSVHFREHCNAYELLLKTLCNIGSANLTMDLYIYNANFDG